MAMSVAGAAGQPGTSDHCARRLLSGENELDTGKWCEECGHTPFRRRADQRRVMSRLRSAPLRSQPGRAVACRMASVELSRALLCDASPAPCRSRCRYRYR